MSHRSCCVSDSSVTQGVLVAGCAKLAAHHPWLLDRHRRTIKSSYLGHISKTDHLDTQKEGHVRQSLTETSYQWDVSRNGPVRMDDTPRPFNCLF